MRTAGVVRASLISLLLISCASSPAASDEDARTAGANASRYPVPSGLFFPVMARDDSNSPRPAGLITGTLQLRDGCLWLEKVADGVTHPYLVLWPAGSRAERTPSGGVVVTNGGREIARTGSRLRAGGGETRSLPLVTDLIRATPPPECQTGEAYWRTYEASPEN